MTRKIQWQFPRAALSRTVREPEHAACGATGIDPATADFNQPLHDQSCFEPNLGDAGELDSRAEEELKQITPPNSTLLELADHFPAPDTWYTE